LIHGCILLAFIFDGSASLLLFIISIFDFTLIPMDLLDTFCCIHCIPMLALSFKPNAASTFGFMVAVVGLFVGATFDVIDDASLCFPRSLPLFFRSGAACLSEL
jgi:hypothetical protein